MDATDAVERSKPLIDLEELHEIVKDCLFRDEEIKPEYRIEGGIKEADAEDAVMDPSKLITAEGITANFGLHKDRLETHREKVREILGNLKPEFKDGFTFLAMPFDKNDNQWGGQSHAEALYCLAAALGYAEMPLPRELWQILPGGVPYIIIKI